MNDEVPMNKLAKVYLKIRDAKEALTRKHAADIAELNEQMELIEKQMLDVFKDNEATSVSTPAGTVMRRVATRYWTNDWDSMYKFIKNNDALGLLEQRVHQGNMKQFLADNPDEFPPGMLVDSKYAITVRRSNKT
jgi:hypothetical protein